MVLTKGVTEELFEEVITINGMKHRIKEKEDADIDDIIRDSDIYCKPENICRGDGLKLNKKAAAVLFI